MTEYLVNGHVHQPYNWAMDWTIQLAPCSILLYMQLKLQKMANQISSCLLIGLSSYALTKPSLCHPAAHFAQQ